MHRYPGTCVKGGPLPSDKLHVLQQMVWCKGRGTKFGQDHLVTMQCCPCRCPCPGASIFPLALASFALALAPLPHQVTLIKQEKVACLSDNDAHLALEPSDPFKVRKEEVWGMSLQG